MLFTSVTFVVFLVLVFGLYWSLPGRRSQNALLVLVSYIFYGWWDYRFCSLMAFHCLVDFTLARLIGGTDRPRVRRGLILTSIAFNLTLLGVFKYFNFFVDSLVVLLGQLGWPVEPWTLRIILPVGISFYTFQSMGYTIDVYRRQLPPSRDLIEYLAYVSYFPQLVAGPIERATNLLPQFQQPRHFDHAQAVDGCRQILWGFAKKFILADNLARLVDVAYDQPTSAGGGDLLLGTICFAFQIYCDFSAYSDIALGTARLLGFRLMRNFAYPYFSLDPTEFWRRWHISLSTWFRDYVYVPLGGSRHGSSRTIRNLFVTFLISGLWHGASWTFVVWGAYHGAGIAAFSLTRRRRVAEEVPGGPGLLPRPGVVLRMAATFLFVCLGWVFFRARTLSEALFILGQIASNPFTFELRPGGRMICVLLLSLFVLIEWLQRRQPHPLVLEGFPRPARWLVYTVLFWLALAFHHTQAAPFIYFQF